MVKRKDLSVAGSVFQRQQPTVERSLKTKIIKSLPLKGGNNSRVYCLHDEAGEKFVIKFYHCSAVDQRNRLDVEFTAFAYLRKHGIEALPKPLQRDDQNGFGIYEYIPGRKIAASHLTKKDLDGAVDFLLRVNQLATGENQQKFSDASEARFSLAEVVENIHFRLSRLKAVQGHGPVQQQLRDFLHQEFVPLENEVVGFIKGQLGREFGRHISRKEKTLSPSDFGFHNALKSRRGIVFFDFEYFGWDDPAKMVSDFLWHPAMNLLSWQKKYFYQKMVSRWPDSAWLKRRVQFAFPLFGLKWCMIILNEFLKDDVARRSFASGQAKDIQEILKVQLKKAKHYLLTIKKYYRNFPYEK